MPTYLITRASDVEAKIPVDRRAVFFEALAKSIQSEVDPGAKLAMRQLGARAFYSKARFSGPPVRDRIEYTWVDNGA